MTWTDETAADRLDAALERILDAAGRLFAERGLAAVGMAEVAAEAGCSRATLYRHVDGRHALHLAYAEREARRVLAQVPPRVEHIADPVERGTETVVQVVRAVRQVPALMAWVAPDGLATLVEVLGRSEAITALLADAVRDPAAGRWLLRQVLGYLVRPGASEAEERREIREFVMPAVLGAAARTREGEPRVGLQ